MDLDCCLLIMTWCFEVRESGGMWQQWEERQITGLENRNLCSLLIPTYRSPWSLTHLWFWSEILLFAVLAESLSMQDVQLASPPHTILASFEEHRQGRMLGLSYGPLEPVQRVKMSHLNLGQRSAYFWEGDWWIPITCFISRVWSLQWEITYVWNWKINPKNSAQETKWKLYESYYQSYYKLFLWMYIYITKIGS